MVVVAVAAAYTITIDAARVWRVSLFVCMCSPADHTVDIYVRFGCCYAFKEA